MLFKGADGRVYERVVTRPESIQQVQRIYTPPTARAYLPQVYGRRSASPRRVDHHRRTPSLNDNGTILPSIEQVDGPYDSPTARQGVLGRGVPHDYGQSSHLIDLTSSAEKATQRMRIRSRSPASPRITRQNHIEQMPNAETRVPPRRQVIELDDRYSTGHDRILREMPVERLQQKVWADPRVELYDRLPDRTQIRPTQRQVLYEPIPSREIAMQQQYYPIEQNTAPARERVYLIDDDRRRLPQQAHPEPPSRYIVLDHPQQMQWTERVSGRQHQPEYRTTYVQQ